MHDVTDEPQTPVSVSDSPSYQQGRLDTLNEIAAFVRDELEPPRFSTSAYYLQGDTTMDSATAHDELEALVDGVGDLSGRLHDEAFHCRERLRKAGVLGPIGAIEGVVVEGVSE